MKTQQILTVSFLFVSLLLLGSCDRIVVNSSENDELIASVSSLQGGLYFKAIVPTIVAKCANCHTHQAWYGYSEQNYRTANLIDPTGAYITSKIYYRLSTATEGAGPHNMPQGGGSAFTELEVQKLKDWIANFGI